MVVAVEDFVHGDGDHSNNPRGDDDDDDGDDDVDMVHSEKKNAVGHHVPWDLLWQSLYEHHGPRL